MEDNWSWQGNLVSTPFTLIRANNKAPKVCVTSNESFLEQTCTTINYEAFTFVVFLTSSRSNRDRKQLGREKTTYLVGWRLIFWLALLCVTTFIFIRKMSRSRARWKALLSFHEHTHPAQHALAQSFLHETVESITFFDIETQTHTHRAS
jgi:hypothetical protein